jgi:tRNA(Ile2) C34 agmatinyltransferase TiaS
MADEPYSRAEVLAACDEFPDRGPLCYHCKTRIPVFQELSVNDAERLIELTRAGEPILAMGELRSITGCSIRWSKIWVLHEGKPKMPTPCPFCGKPLRSAQAKQCRYCYRDWH